MDFILNFATHCATEFTDSWKSINKRELEGSDGRISNPHEACTSGSFIYVAYKDKHVLYVGETSKSVKRATCKRRFITDGSGSHKQKATWYDQMTSVKYIKKTDEDLPTKERKLLEQAFSLHFNPEFYG